MKEKYNIRRIIGVTKNNKKAINHMNNIAESLGELYYNFPQFKEFMKKTPNRKVLKSLNIRATEIQALADYASFPKAIRLGDHLMDDYQWKGGSFSLNNPKWRYGSISNDIDSIFRHEFGHHFQYKLSKKHTKVWNDIWEIEGRDYFKNNVTLYSGTDRYEAFAESFSAYTNPNYTKNILREERLPKKVEKFMEEIVGDKKND